VFSGGTWHFKRGGPTTNTCRSVSVSRVHAATDNAVAIGAHATVGVRGSPGVPICSAAPAVIAEVATVNQLVYPLCRHNKAPLSKRESRLEGGARTTSRRDSDFSGLSTPTRHPVHHQLESWRLQQDVVVITIRFAETKYDRVKRRHAVETFCEEHRACS
jgi:hypothetical protein